MDIKPEEIISDEEVSRVHANARFGGRTPREVVNLGTLKAACGFYQGYTSNQIVKEHGLVDSKNKLTEKGQRYLWAAFGDGSF